MEKEKTISSALDAYFEARAKKWEKYGINWNGDDDRDWWRTTLTQIYDQGFEEGEKVEREKSINTYKSFIQYIEEFNEPQTVVRICKTLLSHLTPQDKEVQL